MRFTCSSRSDVVWKFEGRKLPTNAHPGSNETTRSYWLDIDHVGALNEGAYECYGRLKEVFFFSTATLIVEGL